MSQTTTRPRSTPTDPGVQAFALLLGALALTRLAAAHPGTGFLGEQAR